jgi:hypothetical protein
VVTFLRKRIAQLPFPSGGTWPSCLGKHLDIHIFFLDENHLDESHPKKEVGKKISTPSSSGQKNGL